jgi:hypothetical protein
VKVDEEDEDTLAEPPTMGKEPMHCLVMSSRVSRYEGTSLCYVDICFPLTSNIAKGRTMNSIFSNSITEN